MLGPISRVSVGKLVPSDLNPNRMVEEEFRCLVESMKNAGFLDANPILARPNSDGIYEIVDGERRWLAAKELGMETVPCDIRLEDFV